MCLSCVGEKFVWKVLNISSMTLFLVVGMEQRGMRHEHHEEDQDVVPVRVYVCGLGVARSQLVGQSISSWSCKQANR